MQKIIAYKNSEIELIKKIFKKEKKYGNIFLKSEILQSKLNEYYINLNKNLNNKFEFIISDNKYDNNIEDYITVKHEESYIKNKINIINLEEIKDKENDKINIKFNNVNNIYVGLKNNNKQKDSNLNSVYSNNKLIDNFLLPSSNNYDNIYSSKHNVNNNIKGKSQYDYASNSSSKQGSVKKKFSYTKYFKIDNNDFSNSNGFSNKSDSHFKTKNKINDIIPNNCLYDKSTNYTSHQKVAKTEKINIDTLFPLTKMFKNNILIAKPNINILNKLKNIFYKNDSNTLNIKNCNIDDITLYYLKNDLKIFFSNNIIFYINISNNKISNDGLNILLKILVNNKNVIKINLEKNYLNEDCITYINYFLKINKILKDINITKNKIKINDKFKKIIHDINSIDDIKIDY